MTDEFIFQIFSDTGRAYDRAVVTDGDVMVEVRLTPGTARVQASSITAREGTDCEGALDRVVEFVDGNLCEEGKAYLV